MTETVYLTMPAAALAGPAMPRAASRPADNHRDKVAGWIAEAETRLRTVEDKGGARERRSAPALAARAKEIKAQLGAPLTAAIAVDLARAEAGLHVPGRQSTEFIAARARQLFMESGKTMPTIAAVNQARAEAGLQPPLRPSAQDIGARAHRLIKESGGTLRTAKAVDQAKAEAAAGKMPGFCLASSFETVSAQREKLEAGVDTVMEAQLLEMARKAIAEAHRKLKEGLPLDAGERALDAREYLMAVERMRAGEPYAARRLLQERAGPLKA